MYLNTCLQRQVFFVLLLLDVPSADDYNRENTTSRGSLCRPAEKERYCHE